MSRILFLVSSMQGGGAERVAALLSNHWVACGHQVTLVPTFSGRGDCLYPLDEQVRLEYLADRVGSQSRSPFNKLYRLYALRSMIRSLSPDVIVSFLPHVNIAAIVATIGLPVQVVVSERTYPPAMPLGRLLEVLRKWSYPRARAVVMQTEKARVWLTNSCPRSYGKVVANPVAYPLPTSKPIVNPEKFISKERRLVLAVGRLSEEKCFDRLLIAFQSLAESYLDWDLIVLGEGPERTMLEKLIESLGLNGRVHLPGRVGNLADWYARGDFYVMSSRFEGFPNTLVEAMAHGLPVVSFDCDTGPRDIITEGENGYLVNPEGGEAGLTSAMELMISDETRRKLMSKAAVDVRDRFSMRRIIAEWNEVLGI